MQMIRLYTGADGVTHLEDVAPEDMRFPATEVVIRSAPSDLPSPWNNAPVRQFLIVRTGNVKVEVEDGEVRQLGTGRYGFGGRPDWQRPPRHTRR